MALQQEINDLVAGKHKDWHLLAMKTSYLGELGREYVDDYSWEFVAGFDTEFDAREARDKLASTIADSVLYGGNDYDLTVVERKGAK